MHIIIATDEHPEGEPIKLPTPAAGSKEENALDRLSEHLAPGNRFTIELPDDSSLHESLTELWLRIEVARTGAPLSVVRAHHELGEALVALEANTELGFRYEGAYRRGEYDREALRRQRERHDGLIANVRTALDRMDAELAEHTTPANEAGAA